MEYHNTTSPYPKRVNTSVRCGLLSIGSPSTKLPNHVWKISSNLYMRNPKRIFRPKFGILGRHMKANSASKNNATTYESTAKNAHSSGWRFLIWYVMPLVIDIFRTAHNTTLAISNTHPTFKQGITLHQSSCQYSRHCLSINCKHITNPTPKIMPNFQTNGIAEGNIVNRQITVQSIRATNAERIFLLIAQIIGSVSTKCKQNHLLGSARLRLNLIPMTARKNNQMRMDSFICGKSI